MGRVTRTSAILLAASIAVAGCTVKKSERPPLAGPSELGLSLTVNANPDIISRDGSSQSVIVVEARDPNARAVSNLSLHADISVGGTVVDFGRLSTKYFATGGDGRGTITYTAPPPSTDASDPGSIVSVVVTPVDSNYANATGRTVDIRLAAPGVILPPNGAPTAQFTFSPSSPSMGAEVTFDGSLSTDSDGVIVKYEWNYGDGDWDVGKVCHHAFDNPGSYTVTLTVTDDRGYTGSASQTVALGEPKLPTASFVSSPGAPAPGQAVYFNAAASTAAPGRSIVGYEWDFGDGGDGAGRLVSHVYVAAGTYTVTLVVTDDLGQIGTTTSTLTVAVPEPTLRVQGRR